MIISISLYIYIYIYIYIHTMLVSVKKTLLWIRRRLARRAFGAPIHGEDRGCCYWIAGRMIAHKECFFTDTGMYACVRARAFAHTYARAYVHLCARTYVLILVMLHTRSCVRYLFCGAVVQVVCRLLRKQSPSRKRPLGIGGLNTYQYDYHYYYHYFYFHYVYYYWLFAYYLQEGQRQSATSRPHRRAARGTGTTLASTHVC